MVEKKQNEYHDKEKALADASPESIQRLIENSERGLAQIEMSQPLILDARRAVVEAIEKEDGRNVEQELKLVVLETILAENEVIYDLSASLDALLKATDDYTKRFYMQSLNLCFVEACQLFVGDKGDENGLLTKLDMLTRDLNQAGCQYLLRHIIEDVREFSRNYAKKELRNVTRHYDDPIKMYEMQWELNDIDFFAKGSSELMAIRMEVTVVSSYLLSLFTPNKSTSQSAASSSKCDFDVKGMFNEAIFKALKEKNLKGEVQRTLDKGQRVLDECYRLYSGCRRAVDYLKEKGCQKTDAFDKLETLTKLRMETLFLRYDIACSVWGYLNASTEQERSQNLRLIHITKQAALTHIYGYNKNAQERSLWTKIKLLEEANDVKLNTCKVEHSLKLLTGNLSEDKENSQIFAHYRYKSDFYIPARLEAFGKMVHYQELTESLELLNVCKEIEQYAAGMLFCMNEKQKQERKRQHDEWIGLLDGLAVKAGNNEGVKEALKPMRELIEKFYGDKDTKQLN